MNFRITPVRHLFPLILTIVFLLGCSGCGSQSASKSGTAAVGPQPGKWVTEFSIDIGGGKVENWIIDFKVSEDGKTVPIIQFAHYIGELKSGTNVFLSAENPSIENNSFTFTLFEYINNSRHDYKGKVTFTSSNEAEGTLNIDGADHQFAAAPVSK